MVAFKCTSCKIWSVKTPTQTAIKGMCDDCYKKEQSSLCQTDLTLTEKQRKDLENEVRINLKSEK